MKATVFEKLSSRIKRETGLDLHDFKRTYAGHCQRASGAFVWTAYTKGEGPERVQYGSNITATELLKKKEPLEDAGWCRWNGVNEII